MSGLWAAAMNTAVFILLRGYLHVLVCQEKIRRGKKVTRIGGENTAIKVEEDSKGREREKEAYPQ